MTANKRLTSRMDEGFVVFLIGMRINAWWKPWRWMPVAAAMPRMVAELSKKPELGFLGAESWFGRTTLMLQYWKTKEQLLAFASDRKATPFQASGPFYKTVVTDCDGGIWHETYVVAPGTYENIYVNMPTFGLGAVAGVTEATGPLSRANKRLATPKIAA